MEIVNIGFLAHVDAGKTSLTERILFETGVIKSIGSVDDGTTQTDTLELERARGITIKSAVASFQLDDLKVNLIDTPGHSDFIAEVDRSLTVLDGVVLVISAVEGVQSQTRRLAQAIRSAGLPLLIFVNKIDRLGARGESLLDDLRRKLRIDVVPMTQASAAGDQAAEAALVDRGDPSRREALIDLLAENDEDVIEAYERHDGALSDAFLEAKLRSQVAAGTVAPVYFGSAITGAGVGELLAGIREWLPTSGQATDGAASAAVFKIDRRASGEKIVYVRLFRGRLLLRQRVTVQHRNPSGKLEQVEERITGIDAFRSGRAAATQEVRAGDIAALHGLRLARIGDWIGDDPPEPLMAGAFPFPALESTVRPVDPDQETQLRAALTELAEQDPLIALRQRNDEGEISVRLYGEVQQEVIQATLAQDYRIVVTFGPVQTICIERPVGIGEHLVEMGDEGNPFYAAIGFSISPAEPGSGIQYVRELGSLPPAFYYAIEETVYETLQQGLSGWEVTDCRITLTQVAYSSVMSTAGDFRKLVPLVLMRALDRAGTEVCEPFETLELGIPEDTFGAVCGALVNGRGTIQDAVLDESTYQIRCEIPTAELRSIEQQLPRLTRGEGDWIANFARYAPATGDIAVRKRTGPNPLNRAHYLASIARGKTP